MILKFFEEFACRAGDINSAWNAAFTVLNTLDDTGWFGALRTIRALVGIHDLLAVAGLGNLRHNASSPWYKCFGSYAGCLDAAGFADKQDRTIRKLLVKIVRDGPRRESEEKNCD
jgi:hypothetical protein